MVKVCLIFVIVHTLWATIISTSLAQHNNNNPYSLQPAIDALHHRASQQALRDYEKTHEGSNRHIPVGILEPNELNVRKQQQINRILAKYLEGEEEREREQDEEEEADETPFYDYADINDFNDRNFDERKRSIFRERGDADNEILPYQSVFRERGSESNDELNNNLPTSAIETYYKNPSTSELAREFLREIDHERNVEREQQYRQNLAKVLEKYEEDAENAIERDAIAEELQRNDIIGQKDRAHLQRKEFSPFVGGSSAVPAGFAEKRQMQLPWLPASRRKRFPISKRSPKLYAGLDESNSFTSGTSEKVARDLQAIFGEPIGKSTSELDSQTFHKVEKKSDIASDLQDQSQHHDDSMLSQIQSHHTHQHQNDEQHQHQSSGETISENDEDKYLEQDHNHEQHLRKPHDMGPEHDEELDEEQDEDEFDEEDDADRKKKRSTAPILPNAGNHTKSNNTTSSPEEFKIEQIIGGRDGQPLADVINNKAQSIERLPSKQKKSIQWSKYLGLDRKKKFVDDWFMSKHKNDQFESENPLNGESVHKPDFLSDLGQNKNEIAASDRLENIDQNLKSIENHIIDDTIKYTGSKQGVTNPAEIENLKNHIISRLATAYSLEKMRKALSKLKDNRERTEHLERNEIIDDDNDEREALEKAKRVAIKKEKVKFDNNHHAIEAADEGANNKVVHNLENNGFEDPTAAISDDDKKKKKKKRNGLRSIIKDNPMQIYRDNFDDGSYSRGRLGLNLQKPHENRFIHNSHGPDLDDLLIECPVLDAIDKRCQSVDLLSGGGATNEFTDALLPACGVHQFCYLCGTSQTFCDFQYLSETDATCATNKECQSTAHLVLMILRGSTSGPQQIGPNECAKNPCLLQAMRNAANY